MGGGPCLEPMHVFVQLVRGHTVFASSGASTPPCVITSTSALLRPLIVIVSQRPTVKMQVVD